MGPSFFILRIQNENKVMRKSILLLSSHLIETTDQQTHRVPGLDLSEEKSLGLEANERALLDYCKPTELREASQTF